MKRVAWGVVVLVALALVTAHSTLAQEFWEKKPYTQWNKEQCKKVLENSPWASHTGARDVQNLAFSGGSTGGEESERRIDYYAQLRSALPVRQAVIRRAMIENKYDKMSAEQKKAFDDSAASFLDRQYPDVIVIAVEYSTNLEMYDRELARYFQSVAPTAIPVNIYLTARNGIRIQPIKYEAQGGAGRSFQIMFPRHVNGEPILGPGDTLRLEFPAPIFPDAPAGAPSVGSGSRGLVERRAFFEFKADKMKYKGQLVF